MKAIYCRHAILQLLLLCLANATEATDIYKYRMPDGTILYTQAKPANGRLAKVLSFPSSDRRRMESERLARQRMDQDIARADLLTELRGLRQMSAESNLCASGAVFELATQAFNNELTPWPGERQGIVGGGSRLNAAYWNRMNYMQLQVDALREQLYRAARKYEAVK